jgi:hypothetical protein
VFFQIPDFNFHGFDVTVRKPLAVATGRIHDVYMPVKVGRYRSRFCTTSLP